MAEKGGTPDYWDKDSLAIRKRVTNELREFAEHQPQPEASWGLLWVLSGPETSTLDAGDGKGNQTRERLEAAARLQKEVTGLQLGKPAAEVNIEDIRTQGPAIFFNGTDEQNLSLRELSGRGSLRHQYGVPEEKLLIDADTHIQHTGDQVAHFPTELFPSPPGKLVAISDLSHLPRIKRTLEGSFPVASSAEVARIVLYAAAPKLRVGEALREIKKIPDYIHKKILPPPAEDGQ